MEKVTNMEQASQAILEVQPIEVQIGGGQLALVGELTWLSWKQIWGEIQGLVGVGVRTWNAFASQNEAKGLLADTTAIPATSSRLKESVEGDKYEQLHGESYGPIAKTTQEVYIRAQDDLGRVIDEAAKRATDIPGLVDRLVKGCVTVDGAAVSQDWIDQLPGRIILRLFSTALRLNFFENQEVIDFFVGVLNALPQIGGVRSKDGKGPVNESEAMNQGGPETGS